MYRLIENTISVTYSMIFTLLEYVQDDEEQKIVQQLLLDLVTAKIRLKNRERLKRSLLL